jgi:hypothetical protein
VPGPAPEIIKPANADFIVEEKVGERWFVGDTIEGLNLIRFTAIHPCDSMIWIIGTDTHYTRSVEKTWFPPGNYIPITLIAIRKADPVYFPFDDGADTLVKNIYTWPTELTSWEKKDMPTSNGPWPFWIPKVVHYYPIYGTYYGVRRSRPWEFIYVSILDTFKMIPKTPPGGGMNMEDYRRTQILTNLTYPNFKMADYAPGGYFDAISPKAIYINDNYGTAAYGIYWPLPQWPKFKGYAWLNGKDRLSFEYAYEDTLSKQWIPDFFSGTKVW